MRALVVLDDTIDPAEPLRFAIRRAAAQAERERRSITSLLEFLGTRVPGNPRSRSRYRWELSHFVGVKLPR
jgi:hypothetical protein